MGLKATIDTTEKTPEDQAEWEERAKPMPKLEPGEKAGKPYPYKLEEGQTLFHARIMGDHVYYEEWKVVSLTKAGGWAERHGELRWTSAGGRYLSMTKEKALERLKARTGSYINHCRRRLNEAKRRAKVLEMPVELPTLQTLLSR